MGKVQFKTSKRFRAVAVDVVSALIDSIAKCYAQDVDRQLRLNNALQCISTALSCPVSAVLFSTANGAWTTELVTSAIPLRGRGDDATNASLIDSLEAALQTATCTAASAISFCLGDPAFRIHEIELDNEIIGYVTGIPEANGIVGGLFADLRDCDTEIVFGEVLTSLAFLLPHLRPMLGTKNKPGNSQLPPRLKEVIDFLAAGLSEKQIAAKLQLSKGTIHNYVVQLYRRYEVNSRGELLALFYNRLR